MRAIGPATLERAGLFRTAARWFVLPAAAALAVTGEVTRHRPGATADPEEIDPFGNLFGERNGGIRAGLPTDLPTLQRMLDAAREVGLDPRDYAGLLQQYWLVKAAQDAGIDVDRWDPRAGAAANARNIVKVYEFYGKLFLDHPELQWAGMANMIGPSFAAGFMDLDGMKQFSDRLRTVLAALPPPALAALPADVVWLAALGASDQLDFYEDKFLAMQKHIFIDQASMHEAYLNGGTAAIDEMHRAGLLDDRAAGAWTDIASGDPARVQHGNADLLYREQNQVIARQYAQMYDHDGPAGSAVTYAMTAAGQASIPGTLTPAQYRPLNVGGDVTIPGPLTDETAGVRLSTPLPGFNIADQDARWDYITHDTLPAYQALLRDHPDQVHAIVASSVEDRIARQRLAMRWPTLADQLLTGWDVRVDARVDVHWPGR
jgi:hypothetical protein